MTLRLKSFLTYFVLCFAPLFVLASLNYWNGVRSVDQHLQPHLRNSLDSFTVEIDRRLEEKESELRRLALSRPLLDFLTNQSKSELFPDLKAQLGASLHDGLTSITVFDQSRRPVLVGQRQSENVTFQTSGIQNTIPNTGEVEVSRDLQVTMQGNQLQVTVNIVDQNRSTISGFVVGQIDLSAFFSSSARLFENQGGAGSTPASFVIVLDTSNRILYHTDHSLEGKLTDEVFPVFESISRDKLVNEGEFGQFQANSGIDYLVAAGPIPSRDLIVVIARPRSAAVATARRWGAAGFLFALIASLLVAKLLESYVQGRSKGLEHITENVSAIAKGEIDRRIELKSSDDARGLADNINVVIDQLRAQIAREEETRQFNSFVRLSAMLTHDLKNAIEALSLIVGNMEKHFDNEQFRADALKSLTSATDKLKGIVTRLTRPLTSLSGEHKRPTEVDLVPILNRVLAMTAEPMRGKHSIEIKLPQTLTAMAEAARIEEVMENLVLNALEAMGDKSGKLTIEASRAENGAAVFSVTDTGPGISPEFIKNQLFRPFATTKRTGVGLGLFTCREVVKANAGSIEVESVQGAGTTFRVVLPSTSYDRRS
jgi:signal transduction histidine kinase